jgi:hypothetical protein
LKNYLTVKQFSKKHPFLSVNALRWILYTGAEGLEDCLLRHSNRIYIDEEKFFAFLEKTSQEIKKKKKL